ncbi:MAG: glycosyltransferase family 4 protein [Cyanobacteria bacterium J06633_1]
MSSALSQSLYKDAAKVLFVFRRQRAERLVRWRQEEGPDEMLYGFTHLKFNLWDSQSSAHNDFCDLEFDYIEESLKKNSFFKRIFRPIERWIARQTRLGFALYIAVDNFTKFRATNVFVCINDSSGLPVVLLKCLGLSQASIIYFSQGLSDRFKSVGNRFWARQLFWPLYRYLLLRCDRILVLGEGAAQHLTEVFDLPADSVDCIQFGIDSQFWHPAQLWSPPSQHAPYVLSVGSDLARDYDTLIQALPQGVSLKVVTRLPIERHNSDKQIDVASEFCDLELRQLYQCAQFVVTPLQDVYQPSGQSATLQAMACAKAVILTRTRGIWAPDLMQHLENCYLVSPGNVEELRAAIQYFLDKPEEANRIGNNARKVVETALSSQQFAQSLGDIILEYLK